jgi:hypothetical protein
MTYVTTDVDIDVFGRDTILDGLMHSVAGIERNGVIEKHPTGVYFQNIPKNPSTNISNIDYKVANEYGYFKIDFLNVNFYEGVKSEDHLQQLLNTVPDWNLFLEQEITDRLFHLNGYSHLLKKFKPKSVEDLAMILAIIRPSKAYLQQKDWNIICKQVWVKDDAHEAYQFKKGHGIAYSLAIIVHLNLLVEQLTEQNVSILDVYKSHE